MSNKKKNFGTLLIEAGIITEEQLNEAIEQQKVCNKKLGEVLKEKGYISQQDIIQILESQLGIPRIDLEKLDLSQDIVKMIPENLAKRHQVVPVEVVGNKIIVAMSDPLNMFAIDDIKIYTGLDVVPNIASPQDIKKTIDKFYSQDEAVAVAEQLKKEISTEGKNEVVNQDNIEELVNSAPIVKLVNTVLEQAVMQRASDVHIEPQEAYIRIRYRIDGELKEIFKQDISLLPALTTRIKIVSGMDIAEKRIPQDGRMTVTFDNNSFDLRISVLPTIYGEKIVIRITSKSAFVKDKSQLGFYPDDLEKFDSILQNPHGIILVTGPTGSGKSTTLYAAVKDLNKSDTNIITVEDPVESKVEGINQVQVNAKAGMTFAAGLRSILRQDPDIIMVGEIRDSETANIAISAAITGHLVLSTLHTNDAPSSITRLVDMGVEPFLIGSSVVGIMAQRLVRKVCPNCVEEYEAEEAELKVLAEVVDREKLKGIKLKRGKGCAYCSSTGYRGRLGIYEIMIITPKVRELINQRANSSVIKHAAVEEGMQTLKMNAARLVLNGSTTLKEMVRVSYSVE